MDEVTDARVEENFLKLKDAAVALAKDGVSVNDLLDFVEYHAG